MPDRILVFSASVGGYDPGPFPLPPQSIDHDWNGIARAVSVDGRAEGKQWKLAVLPGLSETYDYAIWVDGNAEVVSPTFVEEAVASLGTTGDGVVAAFAHPRRSCIYAEAQASLDEAPSKYEPMRARLAEQVAEYRTAGYPDDAGLWACGVLAWNLRDLRSDFIAVTWLAECERWTMQDQVSFPVVCARADVVPDTFPLPQIEDLRDRRVRRAGIRHFGNRWVKIHPHTRED